MKHETGKSAPLGQGPENRSSRKGEINRGVKVGMSLGSGSKVSKPGESTNKKWTRAEREVRVKNKILAIGRGRVAP